MVLLGFKLHCMIGDITKRKTRCENPKIIKPARLYRLYRTETALTDYHTTNKCTNCVSFTL